MGVAHPHERQLLLGEARGRGIVGLPETAESGEGRALRDRVGLSIEVMGGAVVEFSVLILPVSVSAGLGQEGQTAVTTSRPKWFRIAQKSYIFRSL